MENEEFRIFIERSANREQMQQQADSVLTILLQNQIVDQKFFADHWGRSTVDQIRVALRKLVNKQIIAQQKAEKEQNAAVAAQNAAIEEQTIAATEEAKNQELDQLQVEAAKDQGDKQHELNKMLVKGQIDSALKDEPAGALQ